MKILPPEMTGDAWTGSPMELDRNEPFFGPPLISGGRMYHHVHDDLYCYDIKKK